MAKNLSRSKKRGARKNEAIEKFVAVFLGEVARHRRREKTWGDSLTDALGDALSTYTGIRWEGLVNRGVRVMRQRRTAAVPHRDETTKNSTPDPLADLKRRFGDLAG